MSEQDERTVAEIAALVTGPTLFTQYALATLIIALAEKQAIDPAQLFKAYHRIVADLEGGRIQPVEPARIAAQMLRGVEAAYESIVPSPAVAERE